MVSAMNATHYTRYSGVTEIHQRNGRYGQRSGRNGTVASVTVRYMPIQAIICQYKSITHIYLLQQSVKYVIHYIILEKNGIEAENWFHINYNLYIDDLSTFNL